MDIDNLDVVLQQIKTIEAKVDSIIPSTRRKRGLSIIVGTAQKWLFGTTDNADREEIWKHLQVVEEISRNSIQTINQQIRINEHFNESIEFSKGVISSDRKKILNAFEGIEGIKKN